MRDHYLRDFDAFLRGHGITRFSARELCPVGRLADGTGPALEAPPCEQWTNIIPTVKIAQEAREHFGRPLFINSGYRDPEYNRAIGGAPESQHMRFGALDMAFRGVVTPSDLFRWLDRHPESGRFGLGLYYTFVHLDTRGSRVRW